MIFLNFKKNTILRYNLENFSKNWSNIWHITHIWDAEGLWITFWKNFFTHFGENQPKNWNFVEKLSGGPNFQFDPNSWQIVKNTQISYFYIALCQYFGYTSSENYWLFPESFKIAFYRDNFLAIFGPFFDFWFNFSQNQE